MPASLRYQSPCIHRMRQTVTGKTRSRTPRDVTIIDHRRQKLQEKNYAVTRVVTIVGADNRPWVSETRQRA